MLFRSDKEINRLKEVIADIFYHRLGGMYALNEEACIEAIHDMIEDNKMTIRRLRQYSQRSDGLVPKLRKRKRR